MYQTNYMGQGKKTSVSVNKTDAISSGADIPYTEHHQRLSWLDNQTLVIRSAAKINLTLSVGPKRPDNFHAFESLMATVTLYDDLLIRPSASLNLTCDDDTIPTGIDNLIYRASTLLADEANVEPNVEIELVKRIPTQAGLGGGSADAAGTLFGLNELWNLRWPTEDLKKLAAVLGSDVGFFLCGPMAICTGRGEIVTPVAVSWNFWGLIVKHPRIALSTAEVYRHYVQDSRRNFSKAESMAKRLPRSKPSEIYPYLENDLESSAFTINPELGELRRSLESLLSVPVRLSGSGSALFALFDTRDQAAQASLRVQSSFKELTCWVVKNNTW
ncbi:MAG: 4-(cytidine 5'-diphospho)-2-C-methyl-D-erythritol kinase [Phycisphaerae bacterium]|nr:4-(cytidine 5'-diphospho)-2-C-methyl-D-erythritol kinase [Phycisphaerae bacterium]